MLLYFNIVPLVTDTAENHDRAFDVNLVLYIVLFTPLNTRHVETLAIAVKRIQCKICGHRKHIVLLEIHCKSLDLEWDLENAFIGRWRIPESWSDVKYLSTIVTYRTCMYTNFYLCGKNDDLIGSKLM